LADEQETRVLNSPDAATAAILRTDAEAIATAHRLAATYLPGAAERDRDRVLPYNEIETFSASGLGGITVPHAHGGDDVSNATLAEVIAIISAADPSLGQLPQNHFGFLRLLKYDPDQSKAARFYALALQGKRFGNALAESTGKTTRDISARMRRVDGGWLLNGTKQYATAALFAHYIPIQALDEDGRPRSAVADRHAPGLEVIDDWTSFGQRTTASGTVRATDLFVPDSHVIAAFEAAAKPTLYGPVSQLVQAAIDLGIARGTIAETIAFVRGSARPWIDSGQDRAADDVHTIAAIGDLQVRLHAADALLERAGQVIDRVSPNETPDGVAAASIAVAEAKVLTTEIAILAANKLFELGGTRSTLAEHALDRHWRNARTHTLHDPIRWKYHAIGNHALNGIYPPVHSWI
jgi:SfnB family sulfur acquisition oxidoreductase